MKVKRSEAEIFSELAELCISPSFIHAIAYFCYRDNTIKFNDIMSVEDVLQQFTPDRLLRIEISTLLGLACKEKIIIDIPSPEVLQNYIDKSEALLEEIHWSLMTPMTEIFDEIKLKGQNYNPFENGSFLREPIFYGGEGAYLFQYRDFSKLKYNKDEKWLLENKGFSIEQAIMVANATINIQNNKITSLMPSLIRKLPNEWSFLPAFMFTVEEVSLASQIDLDTTKKVIESFIPPIDMKGFNSLDDFNPTNAFPIIKLPNQQYLLFQNYSLVQAIYETPFFWLNDDKKYNQTAIKHRGEFSEKFCAERLKLVFGENCVFQNVNIYDSKDVAGEIDVLVVFANRAIVLQAKSKKLTIAARKGNDNSLREDFKKAVQDAYDQAYLCSKLLNDVNYKLKDESGNELKFKREFKEIYPFCVVSEHYPALSFQARQFLNFHEDIKIKPPFVMDVFLIDVMTEMLNSPLYFLSYINRRTAYGEKIHSMHELTVLSYHLRKNLWLDEENSMMHLLDDIGADLDLAMLTRRDGAPGKETPEGILTNYKGTLLIRLLKILRNQKIL